MTFPSRTTSRRAATLAGLALAGLLINGAPAYAAPGDAGNRDWGKVSSNLAQLDTDHSTAPDGTEANGGAHGQHSRSTTAANINGGFASDDNAFGITFNEREEGETNNGRSGVGNVTRDVHNADPGDGGNGVHAVNNANLSSTLDPVTGRLTEAAGGDAPDFSDELLEGTSADNG
jgi:hypothetical protein